MKNEKVRFAIDDDGTLYDHKLGVNHLPDHILFDDDTGVAVNLAAMKHAIENDQFTCHCYSTAEAIVEKGTEPTQDDGVVAAEQPNVPIDPETPVVVTESQGDAPEVVADTAGEAEPS